MDYNPFAGARATAAAMRPGPRNPQFGYVARFGGAKGNIYRRRSRGMVGKRVSAKQIANLEKKGVDTDLSLSPIIATTNTNASSFVLNLVQAGSGSWNRVGRKILNRSLRIKGHVAFLKTPTAATGVAVENYIRMVVVRDRQPFGASGPAAIPTFDTIFGITAQDGTESTPDILNPPKYDNMDRFKVLLDKCYEPTPQGFMGSGTGPSDTTYVPIDEYVKLRDFETVFSGQTAPMTIADISSGALYVFFRALNNSTTAAAFDGIARLRYMN